jgi:hypothetical protein
MAAVLLRRVFSSDFQEFYAKVSSSALNIYLICRTNTFLPLSPVSGRTADRAETTNYHVAATRSDPKFEKKDLRSGG